jgi:glycosyltransferase involved in cell wall biosynthesis
VRVTFLTQYYPPEVGAPQARIAGLARELDQRGVEVSVHTCFPHYPDGQIRPPYRNRPWSRQGGSVPVFRSAVYPASNRGFARRLADHASFALSALATAPAAPGADVVVAETPPLFLAGAAIPYARGKRAGLVLHVADLWPDSAIELGALRNRAAIGAARAMERSAYRAAAAIVCPTEGIAERLAGRPEAAEKVRRIPPSVDVGRFDPAPRGAGDAPFRFLYAGTVGMAQGVETLVEAAARLDGEPVEVVIAGDGADAPELRERLGGGGSGSVRMVGAVPHAEVPGLYEGAQAAVVLLRDRPLFHGALPTKMLEAMAAGRPLVLSASGEAARLVERAGCGVVVPPERPAELADALLELSRDPARAERMGAAGRSLAEREFTREAAATRWLEVLRAAAGSSAAA